MEQFYITSKHVRATIYSIFLSIFWTEFYFFTKPESNN